MMVPVGASDKSAVVEQINAINPKGKTPITKSFEVASEQLKGVEEETTVVLISDGKETCAGDPCALVRSLREQGINVRVHVVGFDVNQEEREQLLCIAEAGAGKYFSADNAEQLTEALSEVQREIVVAGEPEQPEAAPMNIAAAANGGRIVLYSSESPQYGDYAKNLIDESQKPWSSENNAPQSIVIGFQDDRQARIVDLLINPHSTMDPKRWAKEVEIFASDDSPYYGHAQNRVEELYRSQAKNGATHFLPTPANYDAGQLS